MRIITDIRQQQKRTDRYSVYIDGKYALSLGANELLKCGLNIGQELDQKGLAELNDTAALDKAYDRTLHYIAIRLRSRWEVREYLKRKQYTPDLTDEILARLDNKGYVDDLAFARAWVANRRMLKPISKRRLQQELRAKRIDDSVIQEAVAEDETDERTTLRDLVERKRRQSRYQDDIKLMQYLSRQGYNYEDIKSVLDELAGKE